MTIDISLIVIILNFVLLLIILNAVLYKPLKSFLTERQNKIQNDIEEASKSVERANQLVVEKEGQLKNAMNEARSIKDTIRQEAETQADQIVLAAKIQEQEMLKQTENRLETMSKQAMIDIETQLTEIVADLAGKVLAEKIDGAKDKELITKLIAERGNR